MAASWYYMRDGLNKTGPLTAAELRALAASGGLSSSDVVFREGMAKWEPAGRVRGLFKNEVAGPPSKAGTLPTHPVSTTSSGVAVDAAARTTVTSSDRQNGSTGAIETGAPAQAHAPTFTIHSRLQIFLGLAAVLVAVIYYWTRPLTPIDVCRRLEACKGPKEAARYLTLRMQPAFANFGTLGMPNEEFEWGEEQPAPASLHGRIVHCRFKCCGQNPGSRGLYDLAFHLVQADGAWKIDDIVYIAKDGVLFDPPSSFVAMHSAGLLPENGAVNCEPQSRISYGLWGAFWAVVIAACCSLFSQVCKWAEGRWNGTGSRG